MNKEIADLIEKWLESFNSWQTARNYDGILKRMIRLKMVPDLIELSLEEINNLEHKKIAQGLKNLRTISINSRLLYAGVYNSLIRYIQVHQGLLCCVHECKKVVK